MNLKESHKVVDAYDSGYLDASREYYRKLLEARRKLEILIDKAAARGEYESLVVARQILRGLK